MAALLNRIQTRWPEKYRGRVFLDEAQFFLKKDFICFFAGYKIFGGVILDQFLVSGGVKGRIGRIEYACSAVGIDFIGQLPSQRGVDKIMPPVDDFL